MEPTFNDHLPCAIVSGQIKVHDDIKKFTADGAEFIDGSKVDNIDIVVMATGYSVQYPFLDKEIINVGGDFAGFPGNHPRHGYGISPCYISLRSARGVKYTLQHESIPRPAQHAGRWPFPLLVK